MTTTRNSIFPLFTRLVLGICLIAISRAGLAAEPADFSRCGALKSERERLQCFDEALARSEAKSAEPMQKLNELPPPQSATGAAAPTALSRRWELDPETKQGLWGIRPHRPMYVLPLQHTDHPNEHPSSPSRGVSNPTNEENTETEFKVSF